MTNFIDWDDNQFPLAYFVTFRTFGTWLHGEKRGTVDRHGRNVYGTERIGLDPMFSVTMERNMNSEPVFLNGKQRATVERAIRDVCAIRNYSLVAINVRTNHAHVVASGARSPKSMMSAFKANATRELKEAGLVAKDRTIWSRGGSTIYLWKQHQVASAVDYVITGQGADLPKF